jgi:hypothetical protein
MSEYLSPENFTSGFGKTAGNSPALEHESREVKEQAHLAATAQFFYALGLLYTRGLIISPEVPGTSSAHNNHQNHARMNACLALSGPCRPTMLFEEMRPIGEG